MATDEGGYNYNFVEPPPERLLCKICQFPCREARSNEDNVYCKGCVSRIKIKSSDSALKIYCPNKSQNGCGWIGEIARVDDHLRGCEISCSKCKQIVYLSTMKSHLDTECPCYCPYCDMTAEREVISSEHKENCHKFPLTCPNNNIGVDNVPRDKFDKTININELKNEIFDKINEMFNPSIFISTIRKEFAQVTKEQLNDQNNPTMVSQLHNIKSYLTIAVLIILVTILIALLLQLNSLQNRVEENDYKCNQNFTSLQQQITLLQEVLNRTAASQQYYDQLSSSIWSTKLWLSSEIPNQVAPAVVKMSSFNKKLRDKERWYSSPFFAFERGYQMCLQVDAAGYAEGEGTHVSLFLHLMKGPHDDELEQSGHWPLRGTFTIELLNQLNDSDHYSRMLQFHHHHSSECTNRVLKEDKSNKGWSHLLKFISHDTLLHHSNNSYHKSDYLMFRVSYEDAEPPYQVAPVTFKLTHFSKWLESKDTWNSSPFFAFEQGYQILLQVYPAGSGKDEGAYVSVYLYLMKGPHDDKLEQSGHWPMRGTFLIELLNQLNDKDYYSQILQFHQHFCSEYTSRVLEGDESKNVWFRSRFISHDTLPHHSNISYYKSDYLMFRISYEDVEASYQVTPVDFKVTKFSHWLKCKSLWESSPFFAFEGGQILHFTVYAAGEDEGKSTHVSVYLRILKGPHDDKLEQSGHWPLRGTFTIELLNQFNDSDHYSSTITTRYVWKVIRDNESVLIKSIPQYISHDALFEPNGYLINDVLNFRISYLANSDDDSKGN